MVYLFNIALVLLAFLAMEGIAWLTHKYVMHGLLWNLHADHHNRDTKNVLEKNDLFFLFFSIPGIVGLLVGINNNFSSMFWLGLGITIYGFAYFMVHDIFIHRRISLFKRTDSVYLRGIRKAHKVHHKHTGKEEGECFGMLWVPWKYFKEAAKTRSR